LRKQGLKIRMQDQPFQVLAMLLQHGGELVTRDELQKKLWSTDTFVDFDRSLNKAINRLREALGDAAENPRFIETVPKRGYRFIAPLEPVETSSGAAVSMVTENRVGRAVRESDRRSAALLLRENVAWAIAALLLVAAVALLLTGHFRDTRTGAGILRSSLLPPTNTSFLPYSFAISPDGTRLAFVAVDRNGKTMLWLRSLSGANSKQFDGTAGASFPFWSPDSQRIGFFADRKLKTLEVASGTVRILCDAPSGHGGAWGRHDDIIFCPAIDRNRILAVFLLQFA
jgi:DNA-binding winged helix-turn-helix (wHTH) protein